MYIFLDFIDNGLVSSVKLTSTREQITKMGTVLKKKKHLHSYPQLDLGRSKKIYFICWT